MKAMRNGKPVCPEKNESLPRNVDEYRLMPMTSTIRFCEEG